MALVGSSGSGKSTLLDLLLRFKQPTSGRIVIDGRLITNVSLSSLRTQVGWVPQEAVLFDGTFLENITYGVQRLPSTATVQEAIRRAGLADVAARLPGGLEGSVGPGGQLLSHGERQRVALARALVADQPILVLDEMFAGADAAIGKSFAGMLRELATDKTVIVATQQLPILLVADRIYVLRRGRVVERGTHRALVRRGRAYPRLVATGAIASGASRLVRCRRAPAPDEPTGPRGYCAGRATRLVSRGGGLSSHATPSPLRSMTFGSVGSRRRTAWASACDAKSVHS